MTRFFCKRTTLLTSLSLALPLSLAACGDDDDDGHHHHEADAGQDGADAMPAQPDAASDVDVSLQFAAVVGSEPFACADGGGAARVYSNIGTSNVAVSFKDFRLYVSNVRLIDDEGNEVGLTLENDEAFQLQTESDGHVALLDFEDGTGNCGDTGNGNLNSLITGTAPAGTYEGVVFDIGVPFAMNHLDVATAESPLNISAMYWAWAIGHKFARIDYNVEGKGAAPWNFHLGSTGCTSDGSTSPPTEECGKPNRATIRVENFSHDSDVINIDAAELVADSDLATNAGMTPGCMSFPTDEADCTALFPNLGLDFSTGACESDCDGQSAVYIAE